MVKFSNTLPRIFQDSRFAKRHAAHAKIWFIWKITSRQSELAPSETDESGNGRKNRRGAAKGQIFIGWAENGKFRRAGGLQSR